MIILMIANQGTLDVGEQVSATNTSGEGGLEVWRGVRLARAAALGVLIQRTIREETTSPPVLKVEGTTRIPMRLGVTSRKTIERARARAVIIFGEVREPRERLMEEVKGLPGAPAFLLRSTSEGRRERTGMLVGTRRMRGGTTSMKLLQSSDARVQKWSSSKGRTTRRRVGKFTTTGRRRRRRRRVGVAGPATSVLRKVMLISRKGFELLSTLTTTQTSMSLMRSEGEPHITTVDEDPMTRS